MMDRIAELICCAAKEHPDKDIVVTADHGMSRMAALGFHKTEGINAPVSAIVQNHGRYCEMPSDSTMPTIANTIKSENIIAYKTHNHFSISGNAPGEVHGGASPEEILVPIIHFKKLGKKQPTVDDVTSYSLTSSDVYIDNTGNATLCIKTQGPVQNVTVEINSNQMNYMEFGEIKGFDAQMATDAGVIVLGNIDAGKFDINQNMVENISEVFGESATLDRFHGFIPGWEIPRLNQDLIANGWAINTEYFAEVLHAMRDELSYAALVDSCLDVPPKADKRDMTAIKRLCTAFVKLLFPNALHKEDIAPDEFIKYCLNPAKEMRAIIKRQLCIVDPKEFDVPGKNTIPDVQYKEG